MKYQGWNSPYIYVSFWTWLFFCSNDKVVKNFRICGFEWKELK